VPPPTFDTALARAIKMVEELGDKAYVVLITNIVQEKMRYNPQNPDVTMWVIYTEEDKKGIVLGKALALQITEILGSDNTDDWIGKQIAIYAAPVMVAGKRRMGVRARQA
jgi:hypothetical protein